MARLELTQRAGRWLASMACALPLMAAATSDPLEPAKAAIRVKDYGKAVGTLGALADHGDARAQHLLGSLYLAGLGVAPDRTRAVQLYAASAAGGEARAAYGLAALLATDDPPDAAGARRWLARAADLGDPEARELQERGALPLEFRLRDALPDEASLLVAFWRAAARGDAATTGDLANADRVNSADVFGRTALHHAAEAGAVETVELLLSRGARVDAADHFGVTPLMLACGAEPPAACSRLLRAGANVAATDRVGNTSYPRIFAPF